ncbi:MAG: cbb3-type cytochrome oxidase assembly protein CcoS [Kangiellaceae bacterium]|nr:cbb3-type cytochrome oxidase assembly protein CcoS [Kangiellaceae bacterium]
MDAIYFLIPITLLILALAIGLFFWAVNSDQYSDLDREASQILFDEEELPEQQQGEDKTNNSEHKS